MITRSHAADAMVQNIGNSTAIPKVNRRLNGGFVMLRRVHLSGVGDEDGDVQQ